MDHLEEAEKLAGGFVLRPADHAARAAQAQAHALIDMAKSLREIFAALDGIRTHGTGQI